MLDRTRSVISACDSVGSDTLYQPIKSAKEALHLLQKVYTAHLNLSFWQLLRCMIVSARFGSLAYRERRFDRLA